MHLDREWSSLGCASDDDQEWFDSDDFLISCGLQEQAAMPG